jgi:hypothetical protein
MNITTTITVIIIIIITNIRITLIIISSIIIKSGRPGVPVLEGSRSGLPILEPHLGATVQVLVGLANLALGAGTEGGVVGGTHGGTFRVRNVEKTRIIVLPVLLGSLIRHPDTGHTIIRIRLIVSPGDPYSQSPCPSLSPCPCPRVPAQDHAW